MNVKKIMKIYDKIEKYYKSKDFKKEFENNNINNSINYF